jgi:hypothetical protein
VLLDTDVDVDGESTTEELIFVGTDVEEEEAGGTGSFVDVLGFWVLELVYHDPLKLKSLWVRFLAHLDY